MSLYNQIKKLMQDNILKENQKITLCYENEFGLLNIVHTQFFRCEEKQQYKNCSAEKNMTRIYHIPKGKRNMRITNINSMSNVVIYDGFKEINADEIIYIKTKKDDMEIFESKYTAFNNRYFNDLVKKYPDYLLKSIRK